MSSMRTFRLAIRVMLCATMLFTSQLCSGIAATVHTLIEQPPATISVTGSVCDELGKPLPSALVELGPAHTVSDPSGRWSLTVVAGRHALRVQRDGFAPVYHTLSVSAGLGSVDVVLTRPIHLRENIVVRAVRAAERDPIGKTDITAAEIAAANRGQEMPFLFSRAPSVNVQSDSGLAAGYSYFNIRGVGQTRLNLTLDGIPLQDPEDQALYFSNFGDFASVVDSVQIQRGVGTSSIGSASYGGSVNFASVNPTESPTAEVQIGGGSWGTRRATAAVHSGRFSSGLALYGRVSLLTTDGFREHSGADQSTLYYGATWQSSKAMLKMFGLSGRTRTQLAYLATDESALRDNLRLNTLTTDERDKFGQDVIQAQYTRQVGSSTTVMAQGYYNGAQGWFRIWDTPRERLQQYAIDGHFVGIVLGATHQLGRLGLNWGAHVNDFSRDHFMDVVAGDRAYANTGKKNEISTFLKATWNAGRAQVWGDAQVRHARFRYHGDIPLGAVDWTFINPKAGIRIDPTAFWGVYTSIGRMSREPARSDMLAGEDNASLPYDLHAVRPERIFDWESGVEFRCRQLTMKTGMYAMEFRDEIALTGELSAIGLPVRRNVGKSSRRGVELETAWTPLASIRLAGAAMFSRSRIAAWTQFYDVYSADGSWVDNVHQVHRNVAPLLTPVILVNGEIAWSPTRQVGLDVSGRWVDNSQLDNTGNAHFRTPSFFTMDAQATFALSGAIRRGKPRLRVQVTNLFNERRAWPGGYSYQYMNRNAEGHDTLQGIAYFYPLATRSVYVTLDVRF